MTFQSKPLSKPSPQLTRKSSIAKIKTQIENESHLRVSSANTRAAKASTPNASQSTGRDISSTLTHQNPLSKHSSQQIKQQGNTTGKNMKAIGELRDPLHLAPHSLSKVCWDIIQRHLFNLPYGPSHLSANTPMLLRAHIKNVVSVYDSVYKNENHDTETLFHISNPFDSIPDIKTDEHSQIDVAGDHDIENILQALQSWKKRYIDEVERLLRQKLEVHNELFEKRTSLTPSIEQVLSEISEAIAKKFSKESIIKLCKKIVLREKKIEDIDTIFVEEFYSIVENLTLTNNRIEKLPMKFPISLQILNLGGNLLTTKSLSDFGTFGHKNIYHLGLSCNRLSSCVFLASNEAEYYQFPNLMSLDLSYNEIFNMDETIHILQGIPNLGILYLSGNPICLHRYYREYIISNLQTLKMMDDQEISIEERENAAETINRWKENEAQLTIAKSTFDSTLNESKMNESTVEVNEQAAFQVDEKVQKLEPTAENIILRCRLKELHGVILCGSTVRDFSGKKGAKKTAKKGKDVVEEPPEYDTIIEYRLEFDFHEKYTTGWIRESEVIAFNMEQLVPFHIQDPHYYNAIRIPTVCRVHQRRREILVDALEAEAAAKLEQAKLDAKSKSAKGIPEKTVSPASTSIFDQEVLEEGGPPIIKSDLETFIGQCYIDLSPYMEYPRKTNVMIEEGKIYDISNAEEKPVGTMILHASFDLLYELPVEASVEEVAPPIPKKKK